MMTRGGRCDAATRVLVVDDEPQMVRALQINLQARGYDVVTAADGTSALDATAKERPDLVVLDLGLPDIDGIDVIRRLRLWTQVPIVILSGRMDSSQKAQALDAGADDYVTKPFSLDELLARIRAVTRRRSPAEVPAVTRVGRCAVDMTTHIAHVADTDPAEMVHLTRTEWQLLDVLLRNPGRLISQRQLLQEVWGPAYASDSVAYATEKKNLRQYMAHLRRKLEDDPARPHHLITEPGMGYRFRP